MTTRPGRGLCLDRDVPRPGGDAVEPRPYRRVPPEVEAALVGDVRVRVEGDVRDRVAVADEELSAVEVLVERRERAVARAPLRLQISGVFLTLVEDQDPEARDLEVRLDLVLLEEHPLEDACALERVAGKVRRAVREVPENRVRLGEVLA